MINARAETLPVKPAFRVALRKRRCLVVADSFYEWGQRRGAKQPFRIVLKSREAFGFAGLWDAWTSPEGETIRRCTIITTEANELLKPIHDRMPVILAREAEAFWLVPTIQGPAKLLTPLKPYPAKEMEFYPVSRVVNSPQNDSPDIILPSSK